VDDIGSCHDIKRYPAARLVPGLVLFRWDAPLFFANAELFEERALQGTAASPTPVRRIIVTAEPVTNIDVTSADMLAGLEQKLRESRIELHLVEMKDPVKDKLKRFELLEHFGPRSSTRPWARPLTTTSPITAWTGSPEPLPEATAVRPSALRRGTRGCAAAAIWRSGPDEFHPPVVLPTLRRVVGSDRLGRA
jgi:anti-anti-sigma regulatory factor